MTFKGRSGGLFLLFLVFLSFSLITRTVLLCRALPNLDLTPLLLLKIYGVGFFFDCVAFSFFAIPYYLYALLVPDRVFRWKPAARAVFFVAVFLLMFNLVSEYVFFDEFGSRYNFIAIDYLVYTTEVIRNIVESYPVYRILGFILGLTAIVCYWLRSAVDRNCETSTTLKLRLGRGWFFALVPVLAWFCVDLSWTSISPNNYADELAGNGLYDLAAAFRSNSLDYDRFYATGDTGSVLTRLKQMLKDEDESFATDDVRDISRRIRREGPVKKLNVIVVVEESLSAEFLGVFGNRLGLTPNLDRLAKESLLFTNLFATGTRTVRGLEAIALSMPPLPGCSVIKRPDNERLFSWGAVMKAKGYDTRFVYGGNGYFDNMNYFFSNNGFDIVDKSAFTGKEISFENAWGVCDEDLFMKVIREADRSFSQQRPFFSMVMTTSNHRPFTYPAGKVYVPSGSGREGGVMYADYAVGRLMTEARKREWFRNTVFVIVADHCASSARKYALPVRDYRIPLIVHAPSHVAPGRVESVASQIDVAPTVLGLLNFSYTSRFIGRDILDEDAGPRRAFISTYEKLGYLENGRLLVLSPKKGVACYSFDIRSGATREIPRQKDLLRDALGFYQGTSYLYKNRLDRFETAPVPAGSPSLRYAKPHPVGRTST